MQIKHFIVNYNILSPGFFIKMNENQFDVVVPIGPNDVNLVKMQTAFIKLNVIGYRNIYLVCYDPNVTCDGCITIDENSFPYTMKDVIAIQGKTERNGWYFQQILKLFAGHAIPNILDTYLVIDADTFFLKPTTFIEDGKCLYGFGTEYHSPYFDHMSKLHEGFSKVINKSGICHHMMFEKRFLTEIVNIVERKHNDDFINIFLNCVNKTALTGSGASEYELYFNYVFKFHKDDVKLRPLTWCNSAGIPIRSELDYVSVHYYLENNTTC